MLVNISILFTLIRVLEMCKYFLNRNLFTSAQFQIRFPYWLEDYLIYITNMLNYTIYSKKVKIYPVDRFVCLREIEVKLWSIWRVIWHWIIKIFISGSQKVAVLGLGRMFTFNSTKYFVYKKISSSHDFWKMSSVGWLILSEELASNCFIASNIQRSSVSIVNSFGLRFFKKSKFTINLNN